MLKAVAGVGHPNLGAATSTNYSPKGNYDDGKGCGTDDAIGFTFLRSANNASPVTGSQETVDYASGGEVILVYGIGQTAGNLAGDKAPGSTGAQGATTQAVYGAPVELLKGTFTGTVPTFTNQVLDIGNIFVTNTGYGMDAATLVFNTVTVLSGSISQPAAATAPAAPVNSPAAVVWPLWNSNQNVYDTLAGNAWTQEGMVGYVL